MEATLENKQLTRNQAVYDVIISGAGPVGLFLAGELALANCLVLVLEKSEHPHSPLKQAPFGIRGLSAPTIEALYRRGLLQELELHKRLKSPHQHVGQGRAVRSGTSPVSRFTTVRLTAPSGRTACQARPAPA